MADQSLPRTDLVGIKLIDKSINEICFVESKLRSTSYQKGHVKGV